MDLNFDFDEQLEKLAKIPRAGRSAGIAVILAAVMGGYYFFSFRGGLEQVAATRAQSQGLQRQLNKVRAVAANLGEFEQEVTDLQRQLDRALLQLPNRKQFEGLLQDISTAGKKVGVQIKSIQRKSEKLHAFYAEVPFLIEVEGRYHDVGRFFDRLAKLPRIVNVGSLRIRVAGEDSEDTIIRVEGAASTYRFLDAAADSANAPSIGAEGSSRA